MVPANSQSVPQLSSIILHVATYFLGTVVVGKVPEKQRCTVNGTDLIMRVPNLPLTRIYAPVRG